MDSSWKTKLLMELTKCSDNAHNLHLKLNYSP